MSFDNILNLIDQKHIHRNLYFTLILKAMILLSLLVFKIILKKSLKISYYVFFFIHTHLTQNFAQLSIGSISMFTFMGKYSDQLQHLKQLLADIHFIDQHTLH